MIPAPTSDTPTPDPTRPGSSPPAGNKRSVLSSDFETFLKMLTAQARYQDPLEPLDSTEYAAQLAQFSMVEQQVKTNETLAGLVERMGGSGLTSLAGLVGLEARAPGPVDFQGTPLSLSWTPRPGAQRADLVVTDANGTLVQRVPVAPDDSTAVWAGLRPDGTPYPSGTFEFSVESFSGTELIGSDPVQVYGQVREAQLHEDEVKLILHDGRAVPAKSVTALRQPD